MLWILQGGLWLSSTEAIIISNRDERAATANAALDGAGEHKKQRKSFLLGTREMLLIFLDN